MTEAPPRAVTRLAHAKVNLHLGVLAKRPDGYHELETVFERVGLSDRLTVELADHPKTGTGYRVPGTDLDFVCDSPEIPRDESNLVVRAARAFREASGWRDGVRIALEKRIPVGGGLGGGSSDAAATLLALQELSGGALPHAELVRIARGLGADVPFFLSDTCRGIGRGRGDEIEPLPADGPVLQHVLVTPDFPIPTKDVFGAFPLTAPGPDATLLLEALKEGNVAGIRNRLFNALEPTVERLFPAILRVKSAIEEAGLTHPLVSGSGSTVFAIAGSQSQAEAAAAQISRLHPGWRVCSTSTQR